ncbi:MAG: PIG-L family deacetylase [Lunatimonas sp.]|uniref:PIG-L family deacetylase n=1 Tax=Lunatimonas sp. TaxID=2060141 RepID=UPI00263A4CB5|nr:PIG-L family deacetylase [Lunatimonas sp.]MCC5936656.1 PIG-L family deacetylase [Lunatimonas sp.]
MKLKNYLIQSIYFSVFYVFVSNTVIAQTSSELYHDLLKLKETKRVLYVAAHPDDENTRLIAYMANREHAEIAYLSLTRGDGGQNLIGKELGIELGMIRTQELIRARETDGGRQFFSRAIDFGFSKHPDETLNNWDRETLLSDVVWIIRKFQPDIVINRFNDTPGTTHGHHTTSAILSLEAFEKAGDPSVFPDQLKWVQPWQPKRVFWNAYSWGGQYEPQQGKLFHRFEVGEVNPLLGTSYSQVAADSRTMHKSQGFGSTAQVGVSDDFMELVIGESFQTSPFEGVKNRWETVSGGAAIEQALDALVGNFDFRYPSNNVKALLAIKDKLSALPSGEIWIVEKQEAVDQLILGCLGFKAEFLANKELSFPTDDVGARLVVNNPSDLKLQVESFEALDQKISLSKPLSANLPLETTLPLKIPADFPISQPYWLNDLPKNNLFTIPERTEIGKPFNDPAISGVLEMSLEGRKINVHVPLIYKYNDQVDGEIKQPFTLVPQASLDISKDNLFLLNGESDELSVEVSFQKEILSGKLGFEGLSESEFEVVGEKVDEEKRRITYQVRLMSHEGPEKSTIGVYYSTSDGQVFRQGKKRISYKHIPNLTYFPPAQFNLIRLTLNMTPQRIGYIPGAGDDVPGVLTNLGYQVDLLENGGLSLDRLRAYSTIIVGIRAFNVNQALADNVSNLMDYVDQGGNLIVQYNTSSPLLTRSLGPYSITLSRDRVAVEDSPVKPDFQAHRVMHLPNAIEMKDFEGWVQERGLYFAGDWDSRYVTPLELQDPGESPSKGSLLLADFGEGTFAYSGISWFRLLPAGVPGAIKLFVNLIEQGGEK